MQSSETTQETNLEWRAVKDYEGLYEVSNTGRVRRLNKTGSVRELHLVPSHLYFRADLSKDGKAKHFQVHRLVAMAFLDKPQGRDYIDHINGDGHDNRVENLRWCTPKENNNNQVTKARQKVAQRKLSATDKRKEQMAYANKRSVAARTRKVQCIETGDIYDSAATASATLNIPTATISTSCWRFEQQLTATKQNTNTLHFKYV